MIRQIRLSGVLQCTPEDVDLVRTALPAHIELTRAEPGCVCFEVIPSQDDPCVFHVNEIFTDQAAFDAHQARTRASDWWRLTRHIPRNFKVIAI